MFKKKKMKTYKQQFQKILTLLRMMHTMNKTVLDQQQPLILQGKYYSAITNQPMENPQHSHIKYDQMYLLYQ